MIGDAAHAIMPTIGMGASLAIEDAEILGCILSNQILKKAIDSRVLFYFFGIRLELCWIE